MTLLGTVTASGSVAYASRDINECRQFLRGQGIELHADGWRGEDGWRGLVAQHRGEWHAVAFQSMVR